MAGWQAHAKPFRSPENGGPGIVRCPFDEQDWGALQGPSAAFDPERFPSTYAIQNHLAIEVVAHLGASGVPFLFQGGTALQLKLKRRTRFSIDVDIRTTDEPAVQESLRAFADRFPHSEIELVEPPRSLKVDGVRHTLLFGKTADEVRTQPLRILVEVVPTDDVDRVAGKLPLAVDGLDWGHSVSAPTLEGFAAQKFAVLGPNTIGKPLGPNETHARQNQGVCKQIHDLGQLMMHTLDGPQILALYADEVKEANKLRGTDFALRDALDDAVHLISHLREPAPPGKDPIMPYALWSGFRDTRRLIAADSNWTPSTYRKTGGALHRMAAQMRQGVLSWEAVSRPLRDSAIPEDIATRLETAVQAPEEWVAADRFAGDIGTAWAWSPPEFWS